MTDQGAARARIGVAIGLAGAFAYGINVPFASIAQQAGITAPQMSFYRSLALVIGIAAYALWRGQALLPPHGQRLNVVVAGVMSGCIALAYLASVKYNPVALSVVLLYTYPLIIMLIEAVVARALPDPRRIAIFIIAFIGIIVAVGPDISGASAFGVALALFASLTCAVLYVVAARIPSGEMAPMLGMQVIVLGMSAAVMLALGESFNPAVFAASPLASSAAMIGYAIGFLAIVLAAPRIGSTNLGLVFLIEPVVAIISAGMMLGQVPTTLQWCGVAVILAALAYDAISSGRAAKAG